MSDSTKLWDDFADSLPGSVHDALYDELVYRANQNYAIAEEEQAEAARENEFIALDFGEQKMQVHPYFYHYWGTRLGYECWSDDEFIEEFIRDNESVRVRRIKDKVRVPMRSKDVKYRKKFAL